MFIYALASMSFCLWALHPEITKPGRKGTDFFKFRQTATTRSADILVFSFEKKLDSFLYLIFLPWMRKASWPAVDQDIKWVVSFNFRSQLQVAFFLWEGEGRGAFQSSSALEADVGILQATALWFV